MQALSLAWADLRVRRVEAGFRWKRLSPGSACRLGLPRHLADFRCRRIARRSRTPSLLHSPARAGSIEGLLEEQAGDFAQIEGGSSRAPSAWLRSRLYLQIVRYRALPRPARLVPASHSNPVCVTPRASSSSTTPSGSVRRSHRQATRRFSSPTSCLSQTRTRRRRRRPCIICSASRPRDSSKSRRTSRTARSVPPNRLILVTLADMFRPQIAVDIV